MIKRILTVLVFGIVVGAQAQQYNLNTSNSQSLLLVDDNKNVHLLNTKLNYDLGFMNYQMSYMPSLTSQYLSFNYFGSKLSLSKDAVFKNHWNETLNTKYGYEFVNNNINAKFYDKYRELGVKFHNLSYQSFTEQNRRDYNLSYQEKQWSVAYLNSLSEIKKVSDILFKSPSISLGYSKLVTTNAQENNYIANGKNWSLTDADYSSTYHKNFLNFQSKDVSFKSASDGSTSVNSVDYKGTTVGYGNGESFVHSKFNKLEYKLSYDGNQYDYELKYNNIGLRNNAPMIIWKPIPYLNIQTIHSKITNIDYLYKKKDNLVAIKYNDHFDAYDFYFNQSAFSVYDNKYQLIGNSKSIFKQAFTGEYIDGQYTFKTDIINDMYSVNFKLTKMFSFGYLKDQLKKETLLNYSNKSGSLGLGYNLKSNHIDTIVAKFSFVF